MPEIRIWKIIQEMETNVKKASLQRLKWLYGENFVKESKNGMKFKGFLSVENSVHILGKIHKKIRRFCLL